MNINAKELRLHLSEYLDRAARGHAVKINMRGKPVAQLTAIKSKASPEEDSLFGLWADRKELDVDAHLRELRQGRSF